MELNRLSLPALTAPGEVISFYSYKGGTGRSMALSNIALLLARHQGATVPILMIDWDLEAPGLHHYFGQYEEGPGVLEFFEQCRSQLEARRHEAHTDDAELAREVLGAIDWEQYVVRVDQGSPLYLMRAGRFDASYSDRLAAMHWDGLFDACPALFRCFAENLARHFRYVLVDSRTGRTDSAGICTTLLPKKLVVVFTPNRQSLEGVEATVTRATEYRRSHEDEQRPLLVYPLPSRIEMGDSEQRAQWRRGDPQKGIAGFQPTFERLLRDCYGLSHVALDSYFDEVQLQQTKTFAYGEQLAVKIDQGGDRFSLTRTFEAFLEWLTRGYFPWQSSQEIHLLAAISEARDALDGAASRAPALPMARDLNKLGELYRKESRDAQALQCFEESMQVRRSVLGDDHPDTLASKFRLAAVLRQQGRLEQARTLDEAVVAARARDLGAEHTDTLAAKAGLGSTLALLGDYAGALRCQDEVLGACLRQFGPDHLHTLSSQAAQADTLARQGQLDTARTLQARVAATRERLLGAEHPDTLAAKSSLVHTLVLQGELIEALALQEAVTQAYERRRGLDHVDTLAAKDGLALILQRLGEFGATRRLHEALSNTRARTLGHEHPHTLASQGRLAAALALQGQLDAARELQEQVLLAHERVLGEDHLETLHCKKQLAGTLQQQGDLDGARRLEDAVLRASERLLDPDNSVASARSPRNQNATHAGEQRAALSLQQAILAARRQEFGGLPDHPEALGQQIVRLQNLIEREQVEPARALAERLRAPLLRPGLAPKLRRRGMSVLKRMYKLQGDHDALLSLQEAEVLALEGALSEAKTGLH